MRKRFKSKRVRKRYLLWYILLISFILLLDNMYLKNISPNTIFNGSLPNILKYKIDYKRMLLYLGINHYVEDKEDNNSIDMPVFNDYDYKNPTIYVYNTHQTEEYKDYDVLKASKYLSLKMKDYNIDVIVEETNILDIVNKNNWAYKDSYKVTRSLLENIMNDNISLYIDLHRDSSSYQASTVEIDNVKYAKILFVIGGKHESFNSNYMVAEHLNRLLKNYKGEISRGIFVRKSSSYNQDLNSNVILVEVGGPHNSRDEINRSIDVLAEVLAQFIGE